MEAKKCDRCGKCVDPSKAHTLGGTLRNSFIGSRTFHYQDEPYDLCWECAEPLGNFIVEWWLGKNSPKFRNEVSQTKKDCNTCKHQPEGEWSMCLQGHFRPPIGPNEERIVYDCHAWKEKEECKCHVKMLLDPMFLSVFKAVCKKCGREIS